MLSYRARMAEEVSPLRLAHAEYLHGGNLLYLLFRDGGILYISVPRDQITFGGNAHPNRLHYLPNGELEAIFNNFSEEACLLLQTALKEIGIDDDTPF